MNAVSPLSGIPDAAQSAQLGIASGIAGLNRDAQVVAQSVSGPGEDLTGALIDSLQQRLVVQASAEMLAGSDRVLGSLIDVMA
ncbi:MAG TPA: hypothetical protein VMD56_04690 [Steroidobacteraceae bacterium]|nr:hypothetical protein [Steroidobacteraceae bacterium]